MSLWQQIKRIFEPQQSQQSEGAWIEMDRTLRDNYQEFFGDLVADVLQSRRLRGRLSEPLLVEAAPYQWGSTPQEYRAAVLKTLMAYSSIPDLKAMQGGDSGVFGDFSRFPGVEDTDEIRKAMETKRIKFVTGRTQRGVRVVGVVLLEKS